MCGWEMLRRRLSSVVFAMMGLRNLVSTMLVEPAKVDGLVHWSKAHKFLRCDFICAMVKTWVASGLRLPRSGVGRWPLSNWSMQFSPRSSSMWPLCLRFAPATIEWLVFWRWLALWALLRFCCSALWTLLIFWWNISSVAWGWRQVAIHMTSQTVTYWRYAIFEAALPKLLFLYAIVFFTRQGTTARCGLSTAFLSVTFPWHTASTL